MAAVELILYGKGAPAAPAARQVAPATSAELEQAGDNGSGIAAKVFELLDALDSGKRLRKAPLLRVFNLCYRQGLSPAEIARKCKCHRSLIFQRLAAIRNKLSWTPQQLREVSGHVEAMEDAVRDSRAGRIYRKGAVYGSEDGDGEAD